MTFALADRFPGTAALPLAGIASVPTPLQELAGLGGAPTVMVKRDDLTSAAYGGNKVRKLDLLLGDALAQGRRSVLTFGAYGSNHALATAVHARALGLEPHVVLSPQEPGPYAPATLLAHAALGTHIHLTEGWDGRREAVLASRELEARDGVAPYVIPMGGTNALGAIGYVNAALETADALAGGPARVYVAAGTLGTAVGLAVGFAAAGLSRDVEVHAVRVTPADICSVGIARDLASATVTALRALDGTVPDVAFDDLGFVLREELFDPGYGIVTPETSGAVADAATHGLVLETTYTGKALSALTRDAAAGALAGTRAVFWDTYSSAPKPAPGPIEALPQALRDYIAECRRLFPQAG